MFHSEIKLDKIDMVLKHHGLNDGGELQTLFTNEVIKKADPYVPMDISGGGGMLKNNITMFPEKDGYAHNSIYSQFHWYGKVMRDENGRAYYGKAPKFVTEEDMQYQGAPIRGSHWVDRMWVNEGQNIVNTIQKASERGIA